MAYLKTLWCCPVCKSCWDEQREANRCAISHVQAQTWAIGKYKNVRVFENWAPDSIHGVRGALREADLSDIIEERRMQLEAVVDMDKQAWSYWPVFRAATSTTTVNLSPTRARTSISSCGTAKRRSM